MHVTRFNAGHAHGRKPPSTHQRQAERERMAARMDTNDIDAARDIHLGTIDSDFEGMGERDIHIGAAIVTFGYGDPIVSHREAA